ncbi:MAG: PAS domain-containing protein [Candidatus Hydrogenedentes bacterium]|nr:PAS domain-containing protein [Candidatus Hydrogenedentota bacterium]
MTRLDELTSPPATHGGAPLPLWSSLSRGGEDLGEFLENAAMALHWMGPDGSILWANQAELELLGYSREEYIGHPIAEFHVSQPEIEDILRRLREKEELRDYEAALRCKDGSIRWVLITSNVYWRDGEFIHTRCFTKDITERKRREESLQQALARLDTERTLFREVIRQMPLGVVVAEAGSGAILIRNPYLESLTGRALPPHQKLREVQGLHSFHPDGRPYEAHELSGWCGRTVHR